MATPISCCAPQLESPRLPGRLRWVGPLLTCLLSLSDIGLRAQSDTAWQQRPALVISGFAEAFYVYDFNQPSGNARQPFLYNHNRHNELNLNIAVVQLRVAHPRYRANLSLQAGTYPNDNYAQEPPLLQNLFEAHVGLALNRRQNLWLDAGVLPAHTGFEDIASVDNWTMTRSLATENLPYFLAGTRLTYQPNARWEMVGLVLNGWQRIERLAGNSLPSYGTQLKFRPQTDVVLNWSTLMGTDDPDSTRRIRHFHNFFGQFEVRPGFGLIVGFDVGVQQRARGSASYDVWYTPVIIGRLDLHPHWQLAARAEYYQDRTGIIVSTQAADDFRTLGLSLNLNYAPAPNIVCRLEGRWLRSQDKLFETPTAFTRHNFILGTSLAIRFPEVR